MSSDTKIPVYDLFQDFLRPSLNDADWKPVEIWLLHNRRSFFRGRLIGMDEYFNLTLDDALLVTNVGPARPDGTFEQVEQSLGRTIVKGDTVCLICYAR